MAETPVAIMYVVVVASILAMTAAIERISPMMLMNVPKVFFLRFIISFTPSCVGRQAHLSNGISDIPVLC